MALDGIVLRALAHEMRNKLQGGRIDRVNQPEQDEVILHIHNNREQFRLLISANSGCPRVALTEERRENPLTAPLFCMLLRKHLTGGRILEVGQAGLDRILWLDVESRDELGDLTVNRLHIELMGKHSNLIFYNPGTGRIIDSIHRVSESMSRIRQVHPGLLYEPLPHTKHCLLEMDPMSLPSVLTASKGKTLSGALLESLEGLSPLMCREIIHRAGLLDHPREEWNADLLRTVAGSLARFRVLLEEHRYTPVLMRTPEGHPEAFSVIGLTHLTAAGLLPEEHDSPSRLLEAFYGERSREARLKAKSLSLRKLLSTRTARLEKKLANLQEDFYYAENAETHKRMGDLLTANLYQVSKGMTEVTVQDFYDPEAGLCSIPLDVRLTPSENAQRFYRKYGKLKTALSEVAHQMEETRDELAYLDSVQTAIDTSQTPADLEQIQEELASLGYLKLRTRQKGNRKKPAPFTPIQYSGPEGFEILVGRNNLENDRLTLKTASNSDLWFHTKEIPGSHVVIRTQGQTVPEAVVALAARIAAWHSKARQGENVPVDYTLVRHVRKPSGARPGRVIYDHQHTLYVTPDEQELKALRQERRK